MNIKFETLKRAVQRSLKLQILAAVVASLILSYACFYLLREGIRTYMLSDYREDVSMRKLEELKDDFQTTVTQKAIAVGDAEPIEQWVRAYNVIVFPMDGEQQKFPLSVPVIRTSPGEEAVLKLTANIRYRDGEYSTLFLYMPWRSLKFVSWVVAQLAGFAVFVLTLSALVKKKLDYILGIEEGVAILEAGDLGHAIPVKGTDELARLAGGVNAMSQATRGRILSEQKAMQAGREIIGDLSHDIRTPLTVGIGYLTLLLENEKLSEQGREYLTLALKKADQIRERTGELLDYATIYSGQQPVDKAVLEFKILAGQLAEELAAGPGPGGVVVCDDLPEGVKVFGDIGLLERLFDNILSNIRKYGDANRPLVFRARVEDGDARIEIENAVNRRAPADGKSLGLKISTCIAELHGGHFETSRDGGTWRTSLSIPLLDEE